MRMRWLWILPLAVAAAIIWLSAQSHYPMGVQLPPLALGHRGQTEVLLAEMPPRQQGEGGQGGPAGIELMGRQWGHGVTKEQHEGEEGHSGPHEGRLHARSCSAPAP